MSELQRRINELSAKGGGVLVLPAGVEYVGGEMIALPPNVSLSGEPNA